LEMVAMNQDQALMSGYGLRLHQIRQQHKPRHGYECCHG